MIDRLTKIQTKFLNRVKYASNGVLLAGGLFHTARSLERRGLVIIKQQDIWDDVKFIDIDTRAFYIGGER